jgi:MauM/NapG family ferredoxin protein
VLVGIGVAVAGVTLAGVDATAVRPPSTYLRPPGAVLTDFSSLCVRCGVCTRACPTHGLQPSLLEGGWENVFTPHLVPRLGPCLYDCTLCGELCPTGAIPLLAREQKQTTAIGLARIDRNRCLPWAYNTPCIVCEEMCPVPDKAIRLEEVEVIDPAGARVTLQRPAVVRERCVGCGFCEYKCPLAGEAAIRVVAVL